MKKITCDQGCRKGSFLKLDDAKVVNEDIVPQAKAYNWRSSTHLGFRDMLQLDTIKQVSFGFFIAAYMMAFGAQSLFAQTQGAVQLPPVEPRVDQLGQMEGLQDPERAILFLTWFLSMIAVIAVAIALAGHLSLPVGKKTPKV